MVPPSPVSPEMSSTVSPAASAVGPTLPVRIFGPQRSWRIATCLPSAALSLRMSSAARPCAECSPCEKFRRATSIPASMSPRIPSLLSTAGPMVQTIFARREIMVCPKRPTPAVESTRQHATRPREWGRFSTDMLGFRRDAQGAALLSGAPLSDLFAQASVGTPAYVYDLDGLREAARALEASFGGARHLVA